MVAHININQNPQMELKGDDYFTLLVWQNFCFNNIKNILLAQFNQKTFNQLQETNNLLNFMSDVFALMEKFENRLIQEFYRNDAKERNEILEKQVESKENQLKELNEIYAELQALETAERKMMEEFDKQRALLVNNITKLESQLAHSDKRIETLQLQSSQSATKIENQFKTINKEIINEQPVREINIAGKSISLTSQDVQAAFDKEFNSILANGKFKPDEMDSRVEKVYKQALMMGVANAKQEVTPDTLRDISVNAKVLKDDYMQRYRAHDQHQELHVEVAKKDVYDTHLEEEQQKNSQIRKDLNVANNALKSLEKAKENYLNANNEDRDNLKQTFIDSIKSVEAINVESIDNIESRDVSDEIQLAPEEDKKVYDEEEVFDIGAFGDDEIESPEPENEAKDDKNNPDDASQSPQNNGQRNDQLQDHAGNQAGDVPVQLNDIPPAPVIADIKSTRSIFERLNANPASISNLTESLDAIQNIGPKDDKEKSQANNISEAKKQDDNKPDNKPDENPDDNKPRGPRR